MRLSALVCGCAYLTPVVWYSKPLIFVVYVRASTRVHRLVVQAAEEDACACNGRVRLLQYSIVVLHDSGWHACMHFYFETHPGKQGFTTALQSCHVSGAGLHLHSLLASRPPPWQARLHNSPAIVSCQRCRIASAFPAGVETSETLARPPCSVSCQRCRIASAFPAGVETSTLAS